MFLEGHLEVRNDMTGGQEYAVEVRVDLYQDVSICEDTLLGHIALVQDYVHDNWLTPYAEGACHTCK